MENIPQTHNLSAKKSTFTPSKTLDVILGLLLGIVSVSPSLLGVDLIIFAVILLIFALIFAKRSGFKYIFYGILVIVSIVGIVFGGCVLILLNLDL